MARPTKELSEQRSKLINEHNEIFETLKNCVGGLYVKDLAKILKMAESTLKYNLNKCVTLNLVQIDLVRQGTTSKNVVRLTRTGWLKLGKNNKLCSYQENSLDLFYYRAIYQKHFSAVDLKDDFIKDICDLIEVKINNSSRNIIDKDMQIYNQRSIHENLDILNKDSVLIKDYTLSKEVIRVNVHYIKRKIDPKNLAELLDLLAGALEMYSFLIDEDYYENKNAIKIDLEIISESTIDKSDLCNYIKNYKRNFYTFSKEKKSKPTMYNTFKFAYKNRIEFHYIDKKQATVIKY